LVIENKYEALSRSVSEQNSKEAAKIVGVVDKNNYLAHSIREIEHALVGKPLSMHYHILTHVPEPGRRKKGCVGFFDNCCIIMLPSECEDIDEKRVRLVLAHELGHLVYNITQLKKPELFGFGRKPSEDEEVFAWEFGYHLIKFKSEDNEKEGRNKFVYFTGELERSLASILKDQPEIYQRLVKSLNIH
jgi:hypothetical protein